MNLEEANFILNQLTIAEPCINSCIYISVEQVDEAIYVVNKELERRKQKIMELEQELDECVNIQMAI